MESSSYGGGQVQTRETIKASATKAAFELDLLHIA